VSGASIARVAREHGVNAKGCSSGAREWCPAKEPDSNLLNLKYVFRMSIYCHYM
jgi:hypothetical protein